MGRDALRKMAPAAALILSDAPSTRAVGLLSVGGRSGVQAGPTFFITPSVISTRVSHDVSCCKGHGENFPPNNLAHHRLDRLMSEPMRLTEAAVGRFWIPCTI